jgi:hypothetical protein
VRQGELRIHQYRRNILILMSSNKTSHTSKEEMALLGDSLNFQSLLILLIFCGYRE